MRKQELRRERLLDEIVRNPGVMIRDLAEQLGVSRETIRRDLDALCDSGQLQRRYGGATVVPVGNILSFEARQDKHLAERAAIARRAHGLLSDGQVIMLAPGTTALLFARELAQGTHRLTVITNGIREALTLVSNDNLRVILAPGDVDRLEGFAWGHETTEFLSDFNADVAVIFADGLAVSGVTESDSRTVWTVKTMMQQSKRNMLLIDHFRFDREAPQKICDLGELDIVVSDRKPNKPLRAELRECKVGLVCA